MPNPAFQSVAQLVYFISVIHVLTIQYAGPECKNCGNIFPSRAYFKMLKQKGLLKKITMKSMWQENFCIFFFGEFAKHKPLVRKKTFTEENNPQKITSVKWKTSH